MSPLWRGSTSIWRGSGNSLKCHKIETNSLVLYIRVSLRHPSMTGEELRSLRQKYNLTQDELAEALGTVKNRVSEWENGKKMGNITKKAIEYFFRLKEISR
ncbi:MAG TPA: hypothetical protein DCS93_23490 [Microscillaceae bacterium]|nr:hypothetical protein [Microscillaceae bacterium]